MPAPLSSKKKLALERFAMSDAERFRAGLPIDSKGLRKYLHISDTTKKWEGLYAMYDAILRVYESGENYD